MLGDTHQLENDFDLYIFIYIYRFHGAEEGIGDWLILLSQSLIPYSKPGTAKDGDPKRCWRLAGVGA